MDIDKDFVEKVDKWHKAASDLITAQKEGDFGYASDYLNKFMKNLKEKIDRYAGRKSNPSGTKEDIELQIKGAAKMITIWRTSPP
ncbi:MAG: hypothetical protein ACFFDT_21445 [Candidatus Hodarchaeota archaeon]